jgi:hypothetical protein
MNVGHGLLSRWMSRWWWSDSGGSEICISAVPHTTRTGVVWRRTPPDLSMYPADCMANTYSTYRSLGPGDAGTDMHGMYSVRVQYRSCTCRIHHGWFVRPCQDLQLPIMRCQKYNLQYRRSTVRSTIFPVPYCTVLLAPNNRTPNVLGRWGGMITRSHSLTCETRQVSYDCRSILTNSPWTRNRPPAHISSNLGFWFFAGCHLVFHWYTVCT